MDRVDGQVAAGLLRSGIGIPIESARIRAERPCKLGKNNGQLHEHCIAILSRWSPWACCARAAPTWCRSCRDSCRTMSRGLSAEHSLLAGYHNPQGRAIALLRLVQLAADDVLAVLPRELVASVAARLGKFILRAKVKLADESSLWRSRACSPASCQRRCGWRTPARCPRRRRACCAPGTRRTVRIGHRPRAPLLVRPADSAVPAALAPLVAAMPGTLGAVAAGEPQVFAATSEEFVAQMLNLDVLDAIAFDKGCYTGQEVIARAHYRGRVKRRMQRFVTASARRAAAGRCRSARRWARVSRWWRPRSTPDGRCEFLAVAAGTRRRRRGAAARRRRHECSARSRTAAAALRAARLSSGRPTHGAAVTAIRRGCRPREPLQLACLQRTLARPPAVPTTPAAQSSRRSQPSRR